MFQQSKKNNQYVPRYSDIKTNGFAREYIIFATTQNRAKFYNFKLCCYFYL